MLSYLMIYLAFSGVFAWFVLGFLLLWWIVVVVSAVLVRTVEHQFFLWVVHWFLVVSYCLLRPFCLAVVVRFYLAWFGCFVRGFGSLLVSFWFVCLAVLLRVFSRFGCCGWSSRFVYVFVVLSLEWKVVASLMISVFGVFFFSGFECSLELNVHRKCLFICDLGGIQSLFRSHKLLFLP